jgi:hypothetical protein
LGNSRRQNRSSGKRMKLRRSDRTLRHVHCECDPKDDVCRLPKIGNRPSHHSYCPVYKATRRAFSQFRLWIKASSILVDPNKYKIDVQCDCCEHCVCNEVLSNHCSHCPRRDFFLDAQRESLLWRSIWDDLSENS